METIYKQIAPHRLTKPQFQAKLTKDSEYEIAVQNLSTPFYQKKQTTGVTAQEEETYISQKAKLWNDYREWAISEGLYEEVTPEQQLTEAETRLTQGAVIVNKIRQELGQLPIEIKEKPIEEM